MQSAVRLVIAVIALGILATACSDEPPARLPENVTAAIVYNELADRWHAGAIVSGDRPDSFLRVLCLTEAGNPWDDSGNEHTGINIDAQPGETDGQRGFDWSWSLDGQRWNGGRWKLDANTTPPSAITADLEEEQAFFRELRNAKTAALIGEKDGEERLRVQFALEPLFDTPIQFAIDNCDRDSIEERAGDDYSAYAYLNPESGRHTITLTVRSIVTKRSLILTCGPTGWLDDDAPAWIREANGEVYAAATLFVFPDAASAHADPPAADSATVSWIDDDGSAETAVWDLDRRWLQPPSARENLQFIETLRTSDELAVTVEASGVAPVKMRLQGAALFAKPMGAEMDACIREYANLNG